MISARSLARLVVVGLGVARLAEGVLEAADPQSFLKLIGAPAPGPGTALGFRMKGGRDIAVGLSTLAARGDDRALAAAALGAVVIDAVDGIGVAIDGGRTLNPPVYPGGAILGMVTAAVMVWAARTLRD